MFSRGGKALRTGKTYNYKRVPYATITLQSTLEKHTPLSTVIVARLPGFQERKVTEGQCYLYRAGSTQRPSGVALESLKKRRSYEEGRQPESPAAIPLGNWSAAWHH